MRRGLEDDRYVEGESLRSKRLRMTCKKEEGSIALRGERGAKSFQGVSIVDFILNLGMIGL